MGRTMTFDILIVRKSEDGIKGGYKCSGLIGYTGDVLVAGGPNCEELHEGNETWSVTVGADNITKALAVKVDGPENNIRWVATVRTVEVYFHPPTP